MLVSPPGRTIVVEMVVGVVALVVMVVGVVFFEEAVSSRFSTN
jgi:hypothetical protein